MGADAHAVFPRQPVDLHELGHPAAPADVGLVDPVAAAVHELGEGAGRELVLAAGDRHRRALRQPGVAVEVVGGQRLLQPHEIEIRHLLAEGEHGRGVGPAHAGVGHQPGPAAGALAGPAQDVGGPAVRGAGAGDPAELHRAEAGCKRLGDALQAVGPVEAGGAVGGHLGGRGIAQQGGHRLACRLAAQVPQGEVDAADRHEGQALAAVGQGRPVHRLPQALHVGGVGAGEQGPQLPLDDVGSGGAPGAHAVSHQAAGLDRHRQLSEGAAPVRRRAGGVRLRGPHFRDSHPLSFRRAACIDRGSGPG